MNVLLINPKTEGYTRSVTVPLGLLSIASYLSSFGFSVLLYDRTVTKEKLKTVAERFRPDIVGVSLISYKSYYDALAVSSFFKDLSVPVVWGGPLASELPEAVLKNSCVDAVSIGEGEQTWLELAETCKNGGRDFSSVRGLVLRENGGGILRTGDRDFLDLSVLPDLDWRFIDVEKYFQASYGCRKMLYLYAAKGCPFSCTFCFNKDFHRCRYRKKPLDAVLREIRYLVGHYGMDGVYFADELWCRNVREMHEICDSLRSLNLPFVWGCQTRIGIFNEEDFTYMYHAGCRWIFFGVESGSPAVLRRMNKQIEYEKINQTFSDCKKSGIVTIGSFIIGFPGETEKDARQTVSLIESLDTSLINLNYYIVVPGSDMYRQLVAAGKYPEITDLRMLANCDPMQRLEYNFSNLPVRDMKVIKACYMWRSFTAGNIVVDGERTSFTKKVVKDALKSVKGGNALTFFASAWFAGMELLRTWFYAHAYPGVRKRYGVR